MGHYKEALFIQSFRYGFHGQALISKAGNRRYESGVFWFYEPVTNRIGCDRHGHQNSEICSLLKA